MDDTSANATAVDADAVEPQEHGNRLARNALSLAGNIGIALGSSASTASVALTLAAIVAVVFASSIAILICGLPMLAIAAAFRRLNRWRVNCGATYAWGGRAISRTSGSSWGGSRSWPRCRGGLDLAADRPVRRVLVRQLQQDRPARRSSGSPRWCWPPLSPTSGSS